MTEPRRHFHDELRSLETNLVLEGERALALLNKSVRAILARDGALADQVIDEDDEVDRLYMSIEKGTLELLALQTPVASDLRLLSAMIHINLHLERIGDMAVNIAKAVKLTDELPTRASILDSIGEMATIAERMVSAALTAFQNRDQALAMQLPQMDDPIDRINRGMVAEVAACASDPGLLEWGLRIMIVSRQLERVGDHAVDIGEQVAFLLTGEFREFTDASHPELERKVKSE
ncbi:MAG TPA: phosphate signaling complex protein PhoU [Actinomycetota bacterium]|nr:phosphate signaling complex protein PhoU [Actinomycetota bacterium]